MDVLDWNTLNSCYYKPTCWSSTGHHFNNVWMMQYTPSQAIYSNAIAPTIAPVYYIAKYWYFWTNQLSTQRALLRFLAASVIRVTFEVDYINAEFRVWTIWIEEDLYRRSSSGFVLNQLTITTWFSLVFFILIILWLHSKITILRVPLMQSGCIVPSGVATQLLGSHGIAIQLSQVLRRYSVTWYTEQGYSMKTL